MPIHVPGKRNRRNKLSGGKRSAVAVLSLTAMVDMFTVLAVFLLQNYATTNQILDMPDKVELPQATSTKELKPSNVVIVSQEGIILNNEILENFNEVTGSEEWMIEPLRVQVEEIIAKGQKEKASIGTRIQDAVVQARVGEEAIKPELDSFLKMTIQAEKTIDFLSLKKVMYTITEAGIAEINFAVMPKPEDQAAAEL